MGDRLKTARHLVVLVVAPTKLRLASLSSPCSSFALAAHPSAHDILYALSFWVLFISLAVFRAYTLPNSQPGFVYFPVLTPAVVSGASLFLELLPLLPCDKVALCAMPQSR